MSRVDKLLRRFFATPSPKDFHYDELVTLLCRLGFVELERTGGSSHKTFCKTLPCGTCLKIPTCRPHPNNCLKSYQIKEIKELLTEWGLNHE